MHRRRSDVLVTVAMCSAVIVVGCSSNSSARSAPGVAVSGSASTSVSSAEAIDLDPIPPTRSAAKGLSKVRKCSDQKRTKCATLRVPLNHANADGKQLELPVRWSTRAGANAPTLLYLNGGPGLGNNRQFLKSTLNKLPKVAKNYRVAVIETRGTGDTALDCAKLQADPDAVEDVMPMRPGQIEGCGKQIGEKRKFYTTEQTISDLDRYRHALRISSWAVMGFSYGTFEAQRYAIAYPARTVTLTLDGVVPQDGGDAFYTPALHETGRVLREVCTEKNCGYDPAADLNKIVVAGMDGVAIFNALLFATLKRPYVYGLIKAIHKAANGNKRPLRQQIKIYPADPTPASEYSVGLFLATMCTDMRFPYGTSKAPLTSRPAAIREGVNEIDPAALYPFDRNTARGQGQISNCRHWPRTRPGRFSNAKFPDMPTLVINGDWDLATPVSDARAQAARIPNSQMVVVPRWGHETIANPYGAAQISDFLIREKPSLVTQR